MVRIFAGHRYDVSDTLAERVVTHHGKGQRGEYVSVESVSKRDVIMSALRAVSPSLALGVSLGQVGDMCLAWREDVSSFERSMA